MNLLVCLFSKQASLSLLGHGRRRDQALGARLAGQAGGGGRAVVVVIVVVLGFQLGVTLGVAQLVKLPSLLDQRSTIVFSLLPKSGRHPLVPWSIREGGNLQYRDQSVLCHH